MTKLFDILDENSAKAIAKDKRTRPHTDNF